MEFFQHETALVESRTIGKGTRVGAFVHILPNARIGRDCNLCDHVFVENDVVLGDRVTIQCGVQVWDGISIEDDVFVGPNSTFSKHSFARTEEPASARLPTRIRRGASIGANSTILPGLTIGEHATIGAGSVVTYNVPANAKVIGNPARIVGYVDTGTEQSPIVSIPDATVTRFGAVSVHKLPQAEDFRGKLSFGETLRHIPFEVKRYFVSFAVASEQVRGEHAHRRLHQFLVCVAGRCHLVTDDGRNRYEFILDSPTKGIHVPPMVWGVQYKFSRDAVLLVLASDYYDPHDYIRDYSEFRALLGGTAV